MMGLQGLAHYRRDIEIRSDNVYLGFWGGWGPTVAEGVGVGKCSRN